MSPLTRTCLLSAAAASSLAALATLNTSAIADNLPQSLGPVGPNETILTTFGNKRVLAYYALEDGRCAVNAIVFDKSDVDTGKTTAARVRISLNPMEMIHLDSSDNETINLQCGDHAKTLAIVDARTLIAADGAE
jgi:hypothetical protein